MSVKIGQDRQEEVISFLRQQSGKREIGLDQMIGRDIGIYGLDGVEILDKLEDRFKIDLRPLVEANITLLPPTWFDRLLGRKHGPANADLTVRQLLEYIAEQAA